MLQGRNKVPGQIKQSEGRIPARGLVFASCSLCCPRQFLLKDPCTDLLNLTAPELQSWGGSLKGTRNIQGELIYLTSEQELGWQFSAIEVLAETFVPFLKQPFPTKLTGRHHI